MRKLKIGLWVCLLLAIWFSLAKAQEPIEFAKVVGANDNLITELSDACTTAEDPKHCFGIWLAISNAETRMWKAKSSHWYFGRVASKDKSAYWFVGTYNRKYSIPSKYSEGGMFYWYWPKSPAPTRYCMSEDSSNSQWHCPNGRASFNKIYSAYKKDVLGTNTIEPPLSERIAEPKRWEPIKKVKRICYQTDTVKYDNSRVQVDTMWWKFINWILHLDKWTKVFVCRDI